jgi:hypothetical protein
LKSFGPFEMQRGTSLIVSSSKDCSAVTVETERSEKWVNDEQDGAVCYYILFV